MSANKTIHIDLATLFAFALLTSGCGDDGSNDGLADDVGETGNQEGAEDGNGDDESGTGMGDGGTVEGDGNVDGSTVEGDGSTVEGDGNGSNDGSADGDDGSADGDADGDDGNDDGSEELEPCSRIDLVFVIDNSPSMLVEHQRVVAAIDPFMVALLDAMPEAEWHIGMLGSDNGKLVDHDSDLTDCF
ncbi:MAG: hypothetical protein KC457_32390, partial [Myxococcales bacterium]|nr:hypothetical protein [Myxococcales bacterium]